MNSPNILARAGAAEISLKNGALPRHVQWMPPGRQTVQPIGFEEPFEMNVTAAIAAAADRQLQQLRAEAAAGKDAEPYGDFNHKDEGRAFIPRRFFWGGDNPKEGGVRLELVWTGAGAKSVLDGELCCISASWTLHKHTKAFLGIRPNVGGLVPRSAFHAVQAFAKVNDGTAAQAGSGFIAEAKTYAKVHRIADEQEAMAKFADTAEGNKLYQEYRTGLFGGISTHAQGEVERGGTLDPELIRRARELADAEALPLSEAMEQIARKEPALWADYIYHLTGRTGMQLRRQESPAAASGSVRSQKPIHEFLYEAWVFGDKHGISDTQEAQAKFISTPRGQELYAAYCRML